MEPRWHWKRTSVKRGISEQRVKEIVSASFDELSFQVRKLEAGVTEGICIHTPHWKTHVFNFQTWKQLLLSGGEMKSQASFCKPHAKKKEARRQVYSAWTIVKWSATAAKLLEDAEKFISPCKNHYLPCSSILSFYSKVAPIDISKLGSNYFEKSIQSHTRKWQLRLKWTEELDSNRQMQKFLNRNI